ncbi:hypothetical protein PA0358 [Candidatus Phytoplasma australiense]|uniref:DUF2963 domain-containing protein n=1 Tax=Phytoplasma australiense TaxID=59748 RepID=B1V9S1_PHYAS|nr:hypothetical protein PA0358 [Candidatus Phytoplasma australiense]
MTTNPNQKITYRNVYKIITEFSPITNKKTKETECSKDGKTIYSFASHNSRTGNKTKQIIYQDNMIWRIYKYEYNLTTIKETIYYPDNTTINMIQEYDRKTQNRTKQIIYSGGITKDQIEHNPETGEQIKRTYYRNDGKTTKEVEDCNPQTRKLTKRTYYHPNGKIKTIHDFDPETGKKTKYTKFKANGVTIEYTRIYRREISRWVKISARYTKKEEWVAYHEAGHALITFLHPQNYEVAYLTIIPNLEKKHIRTLSTFACKSQFQNRRFN